jgi:hypothetical protein
MPEVDIIIVEAIQLPPDAGDRRRICCGAKGWQDQNPPGCEIIYDGLYFMGYFDSLRGFLYETNLASKKLAGEIRRYLE